MGRYFKIIFPAIKYPDPVRAALCTRQFGGCGFIECNRRVKGSDLFSYNALKANTYLFNSLVADVVILRFSRWTSHFWT